MLPDDGQVAIRRMQMGIVMPSAHSGFARYENRDGKICWNFVQSKHHGFWYFFLAAVRLVGFLLDESCKSSQKLLHGRSYAMAAYCAFLWANLVQVQAGEQTSTRNITLINEKLYHQGDYLLKEVESLALRHPESMRVNSLRSESDGYASEIMVATIDHAINDTDGKDKYRILLSFGQHGRELITSEVALRLLNYLVGEKDPAILNNELLIAELRNTIIKIIPMENYNGRKIVESGHLCERKNGRGVDINRNWSVDWGKEEPDFDPSEEYPGIAPFSEPETRIMRDLAKSFKPHLWINVHSGMQAMFMPFDYKNALPDPEVVEPMKLLLQELNHLHCNSSCVIGGGGSSVGYLAHGTATDYMYEALGVPLAFTFEIYGDTEAPHEDCFRMFNPVTPTDFESTVTNWCSIFITIFAKLEGVIQVLGKSNNDAGFHGRNSLNRKLRLNSGYSYEKGLWSNEKQTLWEFIIIFSFSYLAFVWYVYLKCQSHSLQTLRSALPRNVCNYFQIMLSQ